MTGNRTWGRSSFSADVLVGVIKRWSLPVLVTIDIRQYLISINIKIKYDIGGSP